MARTTPRRRTAIGVIGAGMAMVAFSALSSPADAAINPTPYDGNPSCNDLGFDGVKIDAQPSNGTYSGTDFVVEDSDAISGAVPADLEIEVSNVIATPTSVTFSWHATTSTGDFPIDVVLVKFANGGLRWDYAQPGQSSDVAASTQDSISHVSFCFDGTTGGTTTGGDTTGGDTTGGDTTGGDTTGGDTTGGDTTGGDTTGDVQATTGPDEGNEVLGNTITRQGPAAPEGDTLPATGSDATLAIGGATLIALGAAGMATSSWLRRPRGAHFEA